METIVFETNGIQSEARVETAPYPRSRIDDGYLVVEHSSGNYMISIDVRDGEYVANPVSENT